MIVDDDLDGGYSCHGFILQMVMYAIVDDFVCNFHNL